MPAESVRYIQLQYLLTHFAGIAMLAAKEGES